MSLIIFSQNEQVINIFIALTDPDLDASNLQVHNLIQQV